LADIIYLINPFIDANVEYLNAELDTK